MKIKIKKSDKAEKKEYSKTVHGDLETIMNIVKKHLGLENEESKK